MTTASEVLRDQMCRECGREWVALMPDDAADLECPTCHKMVPALSPVESALLAKIHSIQDHLYQHHGEIVAEGGQVLEVT